LYGAIDVKAFRYGPFPSRLRIYCFAVMGWPGRAQRPNLLDRGWEA
jgi:hypothetical protein